LFTEVVNLNCSKGKGSVVVNFLQLLTVLYSTSSIHYGLEAGFASNVVGLPISTAAPNKLKDWLLTKKHKLLPISTEVKC
jgi:hypothetical protein